jgi:heme/copper-type cytochrome/quinol oxidase subunit 2
VCGLLGLLPVVGLPFAFAALVFSREVRAGQKKYWNAARLYWIWGVVCAAAGPIFWTVILTLIISARIRQ